MLVNQTGDGGAPTHDPVLGRRGGLVVGLLLLLFIGLALSAVEQKSPTIDETYHLVAGYSYWKWGDYRLNPEHPPLAKLLAALPLFLLSTEDSPLVREERDKIQAVDLYGWRVANRWLFERNDGETMFLVARLPMLLAAALLGLLIFFWARDLYGISAGFAALVLFVFDPNMLAHGPLVHTDMPVTLAIFGASYFFWRALRELTWFNGAMTLVFFAAAALTKFSFIILPLLWGLLAVGKIVSSQPLRCRIGNAAPVTGVGAKTVRLAAFFLCLALGAYAALWAAYGWRYQAVSGQVMPLTISHGAAPMWWLDQLRQLNYAYRLFPEAWLAGLVHVLANANRTSYLLGEVAYGFWNYFPIALAVKTPLPTLLLLLVSPLVLTRRRQPALASQFIWLPMVGFFALAIYSRMNLGLRHILPIYPFLFVWLGGASAALLSSPARAKRCAIWSLAIWLVASCAIAYPDYLAFFNETLGGRRRHEILVDSNLDWGQDIKGLKRWMVDQHVDRIELAYFGAADPAYYGIDAIYRLGTLTSVLPPPPASAGAPSAPYIAISATHLVGLYLGANNPYKFFLGKTPVADIGHSIFVYRTGH